MIREGTIGQLDELEKVILTLEYEVIHDGSKSKERMFLDQGDSRVYYKLYEIYTEPTGYEIAKLIMVKSGVVRLYYDFRNGSGLCEMTDRDYGNLWKIIPFREAVRAINKNGNG